MAVNLRGRSFLTLLDFTPGEIRYLLDLSRELKAKKRSGIAGSSLSGKNIVVIFEKTSTRTRCAFEVAAYDEGAQVTFLTNSQMGKKESVEDTAKVLGRMYDGIEFRGYAQETVEKLAKHSGVPVWNGLTDMYHPTQVLADFMTMEEHMGKPLSGAKLLFIGDGRNNMANSLMIGSAKMGLDFSIVAPKALFPDPALVEDMKTLCAYSGASITVTDDIDTVIEGADALYTDVWVSMGEEHLFDERIRLLKAYQVTMDMLRKTGNDRVLFLHCLPSYHDKSTEIGAEVARKFGLEAMEVTDEVFRSRHSVVFDEAENRMHTIKAVMVATIGSI